MAEVKRFDLDDTPQIIDDEDEQTLAAIDEGLKDAEAGRLIASSEARKMLPTWITKSSTLRGR